MFSKNDLAYRLIRQRVSFLHWPAAINLFIFGTVMRNKELVQRSARIFMQEIGPCYPANLHQIAQRMNIQIHYRSDLPQNVNGATVPLNDGSYVVAIKSHQSFLNERFSIAREIAHIVLGHCAEGIVITSALEMHNQGVPPCDRESYTFALELLVPLEQLKHAVSESEFLDIDKLCTLYGVSGEIIKTRLDELGLIQSIPSLPHTLSLVCCL